MDWVKIGCRIRKQREYLGYTREYLAEKLDITPKFCYDIELGVKGMSVPTLCRIAAVLNLSVDYILFGVKAEDLDSPVVTMLRQCPPDKLPYAEEIVKSFILAVGKDSDR